MDHSAPNPHRTATAVPETFAHPGPWTLDRAPRRSTTVDAAVVALLAWSARRS